MEFLNRHYEKLILLALSIISLLAVWYMSDTMEKTKEVQDSSLQIHIPAADQRSLKKKKEEYFAKKAEIAKEIAQTKGELEKADRQAKKSKTDEDKQTAEQLRNDLNSLVEKSQKLDEDKDLMDFLSTKEFDSATLIEQNKLVWARSAAHSSKFANYHSDLVEVFKMATCPHCHYGVPYYCFTDSHKCVICHKELKSPPAKIKKRRRPTPDDIDGDGINNDNEARYGFDPKDPTDALLDADGDGFSNLYEINVSQTDPRNPTSCPPLWRRLRFKGMAKIKLPIQISSVDAGTGPDPKTWEVSIKMDVRNPKTGKMMSREQDCRIGSTLNFDGRKYELSSIERRVEKNDRGIDVRKDIVTLKMIAENEGEKAQEHELKLVFGEPVYSSDLRVVLEDIGVPANADGNRYYTIRGRDVEATFALRKGEVFEMGGISDRGSARNVPKVAYVLARFDEKSRTANLSRVKNRKSEADEELEKDEQGVPMEVTWDSYIVEDEWVSVMSEKQDGSQGRGGNAERRGR